MAKNEVEIERPHPGDYFVLNEDGRQSKWQASIFEDMFSPVGGQKAGRKRGR